MQYKIVWKTTRPDEYTQYWAEAYPNQVSVYQEQVYLNGLMKNHYHHAETPLSALDICYFNDENMANSYISFRDSNQLIALRNQYDIDNQTTREIIFSGWVEDNDIPY